MWSTWRKYIVVCENMLQHISCQPKFNKSNHCKGNSYSDAECYICPNGSSSCMYNVPCIIIYSVQKISKINYYHTIKHFIFYFYVRPNTNSFKTCCRKKCESMHMLFCHKLLKNISLSNLKSFLKFLCYIWNPKQYI